MRINCLLFIIAIVFCFSCKKPKDESAPSVQIEIPSGSIPTFDFEDPIFIQFSASDNEAIGSWIVTVDDESGITRYSSGTRTVSNEPKELTADVGFFFDDVHWPGGDYLITVQVFDLNDNRNAAFKTIRYNAPPLELESILLFSNAGQTCDAEELNLDGSFTPIASFGTNGSIALAGSWHQELVLGGKDLAETCFTSFENPLESNCFSGANPLGDEFTRAIYFDESTLTYLVASSDGTIRDFLLTGNLTRTFTLTENFVAEELIVSSGRIVAALRNESQNLTTLASIDRFSGALIENIVINGTVSSLCHFNEFVLISGTSNNTPFVYYADPQNLAITDLNWFVSDEPLRKTIELTPGRYALAHANGIYLHIFETSQFQDGSANGINALDIAFDAANNRLYAIDNSTIYQLNTGTMAVMNSWNAPPGVFDIELLFNK